MGELKLQELCDVYMAHSRPLWTGTTERANRLPQAESLCSPKDDERPASSLATGTRNGEHET